MESTETYASEAVIAIFNSPQETGEAFGAPIVVGHYGSDTAEVFIRQGRECINIQAGDVKALCRILKKASDASLKAAPDA